MAIFNRALDFFNGSMGPVEPQRFQVPMSQPYVDDMFDPLFNREVVSYNRDLYGALGAIPAGYAQMWENALTGQEGILGPGMGILSTFGRSMDKADDFILGGLTEGVNAVGRFVGTNDAPTNPIANIFVEDQNYEGSDLLAAMGNAMGKLAGGAKLDRGDFQNLPDRLQSSVVNLATDPGFMGGNIARANPANRAAKALYDYDNVMAEVAGNMALPGAKIAAQTGLRNLINLVGGTMNAPLYDYQFTDGAQRQISDMMASYAGIGGVDHLNDGEYAVYRLFNPHDASALPGLDSPVKYTFANDAEDMLKAFEDERFAADKTIFGSLDENSPVLRRFEDVIPTSSTSVNLSEIYKTSDDVRDFLDSVANKLKSKQEQDPGDPFFGRDDVSRFLNDYDYAIEQQGGVDEDANRVLLGQLQDIYDSEGGFVTRTIDDMLDVGNPFADMPGSAYLSVSDVESRKATAEHYAAVRESLVNETAEKLSPSFSQGASEPEDAVGKAFAEYARVQAKDASVETLVHSMKHYEDSTQASFKRLTSNVLKHPDDNALPFRILDSYLRIRKKNAGTAHRVALQDSFDENFVLNKGFKRYEYRDVCDGYIKYFNSLGANLPENANFEQVARWYSSNRIFVKAVQSIIEKPEDDLADDLPRLLAETKMSQATREKISKWLDLQQENEARSYAKRLSDMPFSTLKDVQAKNEKYITNWNARKSTIAKRQWAIENALKHASGADKSRLQAYLKDIEALQNFVDRLERLELAASTTTPKYIRKMHANDPGWVSPVTVRDVLFQSTTSAYIGDDLKSMMDYLDQNPSKTNVNPLDWVIRPHRRILANDFRPDGKHVRPEARLLTAFAQPGSLSNREWDLILHPHYKGGDMALHMKNMKNLLKDIYLKPGKVDLDIDGQKAYVVSDEAIPYIVPDPKHEGWYKVNPKITPEMARYGDFEFRGRLDKVRKDMFFEDDGLYIGPNALNYFTRHGEGKSHGDLEYEVALKAENLDPKFRLKPFNASYWTAEETAKLATDPPQMGDAAFYDLSDRLTAPIADNWNVAHLNPLDPDDVTFIKRVGTPKDQSLFAYLARMAVGSRNAKMNRRNHAFLNKRTLDVIERAKQAKSKYHKEFVSEYLRQRDAASDSVVLAKDFVGSLVNSEGFKIAIVKGQEAIDLHDVIESNVSKVNAAVGEDVLKVIYKPATEAGRPDFVGYAFNDANPKVKRHLNEYVKHFDGEYLNLQDVVFHKGTGTYGAGLDPKMVEELDSIFNDTTSLLNEYTGRFGFTPFDKNYIRHDLTDDLQNTFGFVKHKEELGVSEARQIADALSDIREFDKRTRRVLGTKAFDRSWYGDLDYYGDGFSKDVEAIVQSTFTKGALDNANAALAQELFFNKNFSLKRNFADPRQIMDALRQEGSSNMVNLQIVVPKYNDDGVLVGFSKVDAYDDAGILKAYENDDAILVPKSIFGRLDRVLKKEAKMNSGMYRFFQKYFTVPFKLGVISNLGFLFGNVQDASFKQVESFMRRYDTSFDEECYNAAASYRHAVDLQNKFSDVVDKYVEHLKGNVDKKTFKNSLATVKKTGTVDPALITSNPHYLNEFVVWLAGTSEAENDISKLYLFSHSIMDVGTFENNYLDLEDLTQIGNKKAANAYDIPLNIADRILYGDRSAGEKDFKRGPLKGKRLAKFGIVTNSGTNLVLKPSNAWEHTTRLATVLNYMRHEGWTDDDIAKTLGSHDAASLQKLRVDMLQGVDMMNHANFDYDDVTDFMDKISYAVPFPTFYLKNIAHWMEVFVEHPQMIDDIISYQEGLWQNKDTKDDEFMAEAKGRGAYPLGGRTKFGTGIVKQSPVNSMFSAFSAVNNFKEDFAYRTHPAARPLARHLQSQEDVKYRPYSMDPYEKNIKKGDKQFSELSYMFHQLNPYERYVNTYLRTPKKISTNDYQASDFLPSVFQPDFGKKRR